MAVAKIQADTVNYELQVADPSGVEGDTIYNSTSKKLKFHNGTVFTEAGGGASFTITNKSANYVITAAEANGFNGFSNTGAITFTLPAVDSTVISVSIFNNDGNAVVINRGSTDTILNPSAGTTGLTSLTLSKKGSLAIFFKASATEWTVFERDV